MKPLLVLFIASMAAGPRDIAPNPVNREGTALQPGKETAIAMTSEKVVMTLTEDSACVRASFVLENTSEAAERLEVGFPGTAQPMTWSIDRRYDTSRLSLEMICDECRILSTE